MELFRTAVILAGGQSSRMGFDKQLLAQDGRMLYAQTVERLQRQFADILLVTNTPVLYQELSVRVCTDVIRGRGPLGGIHSALLNAESRYVYVLACDMPCLCPDYVSYQMELLRNHPAGACVTRKDNWLEPFNAFYSIDTLPQLTGHLEAGKSSLFFFLREIGATVIAEETARRFDPDLKMFLNLNTPVDYDTYLAKGCGI